MVGDAVQAAFPTAPDAVAAALDAQQGLMREAWPEGIGPLRVRMALHTAAATPQDGDYLRSRVEPACSPACGRPWRTGAFLLGHPGSRPGRASAEASLRDLGEHPLRDLYRPERVFQLLHPDLPADFPPIRTLATRPNNLPFNRRRFSGGKNRSRALLASSAVMMSGS